MLQFRAATVAIPPEAGSGAESPKPRKVRRVTQDGLAEQGLVPTRPAVAPRGTAQRVIFPQDRIGQAGGANSPLHVHLLRLQTTVGLRRSDVGKGHNFGARTPHL